MYCFRDKDWSFIKTPNNVHFLKAEKFQAKSFFSQEGFHHWAISAPICYPGGLSPPIYIPDTSNVVSSKLSFVSRGTAESWDLFSKIVWHLLQLWFGDVIFKTQIHRKELSKNPDKEGQKSQVRLSVKISSNPREFVPGTLPPLEKRSEK